MNQIPESLPDIDHMKALLIKCREETNPQRLLRHMQALKTFFLAHLIQQSTLVCQLQEGHVVEGELEDRLMEECSGCLGEAKKLLPALHIFLRRFEDEDNLDTMEFRVSSQQLITKLSLNLSRFQEWAKILADRKNGLEVPPGLRSTDRFSAVPSINRCAHL